MIDWPTKDSITQTLVENIAGSGKTISDLANQWVMKHLIIGIREALWMIIVVIKVVYDQATALGATGTKLEQMGYERGVDKKLATKAVHSVTLNKSSPVSADLSITDNFLLTTTPTGNNPPVQFRVQAGQSKVIGAGTSSVTSVMVECTEKGEIGNVPSGAINLVAQAGIDSVTNSVLVEAGTDVENEDSYRTRVIDRKRNPERGGVKDDYKFWAESVEGVISATIFPRNRGNGTVDILIAGSEGMPGQVLVDKVQAYIDTKTPADIADGGVRVISPTGAAIDVTLTGCVWRTGYDVTSGGAIVKAALTGYINGQSNLDRVVRMTNLITAANTAYDPVDPDKKPVLLDFSMTTPTANRDLSNTEMALPGNIQIL